MLVWNRFGGSMKIDDGSLNRYLIKNLQPLTEADPSLLANYVAALLKNHKPKNELQKLCIDQLYDFLGDGTKSFVGKLFQSLEDGTVSFSAEESEPGKPMESISVIASVDAVELRTSPPHSERPPSTAIRSSNDEGEESTDDEDDDRNHKHRRRVSRSRSFDRDGKEQTDRSMHRKRGRVTENGPLLREDEEGNERRGSGHTSQSERDTLGKFDRRAGRDHDHGSGRFNADGAQRGPLRPGPSFREGLGPRFDGPNGLMRGSVGRGRGIGAWASHDQRFPPPPFPDGPDFGGPLLPPGPGAGFFPGRGLPGRGGPHTPWPGYGPALSGLGNGPLEHSHPLSGAIAGGRGPPISAGVGMSMGRPRCLDFEERGYCLRGDLCPMEHGANRIVVEDVQSLSKFNLPVSLPSGRGLTVGPASVPSPAALPPTSSSLVNRNNHGSRDASLPVVGDDSVVNGVVPGNAIAEPDSYDPDQPLWTKERAEASLSVRALPPFQKGGQDSGWDGHSEERKEDREASDSTESGRLVRIAGTPNGGLQTPEGGASVWDRIGPVGSRSDSGLSTSIVLDLPHVGRQLKKGAGEEAILRPRGGLPGKWSRDTEPGEENTHRGSLSTLSGHGRGRASGRGDNGTNQRSGEGTSYPLRAGNRAGSAFGTDRAQRTLYVSFIPPNSNRTEQLLTHFQKFGDVLDVRIPAQSDRAFVQFSRRGDAEAALTAPDAVMGNRFIRLSWANRDSILDPVDHMASNREARASSGISTASTVQISNVPEKLAMNGIEAGQLETVASEVAGKTVSADGLPSTPSGSAVKKQEELERMKEELRLKQEALAQKRNDFRRKLDQLAKGPVHGDATEPEQPLKRQRLNGAEDNSTAPAKVVVSQSVPSSSAPQAPQELSSSATLVKTMSGDTLNKQSGSPPVLVQPPQPLPRVGRSSNARMSNNNITYMPWGPARYRLDNRTTIFRVLPPFPASVADVGVLKDHFMMYGEQPTVEVEDLYGQKTEENTTLNETTFVRVSFATRRAAERAFVQGRWMQGQNLQLAWVNSSGITSSSGTPVSTPRATELSGERTTFTHVKHVAGSPFTDSQGANGTRLVDPKTTEHYQTATDENTSGKTTYATGGPEKTSIITMSVDGSKEGEDGARVNSKSGSYNLSRTGNETGASLACESTEISNLS